MKFDPVELMLEISLTIFMSSIPAYLAWLIIKHYKEGAYGKVLKMVSYSNLLLCAYFIAINLVELVGGGRLLVKIFDISVPYLFLYGLLVLVMYPYFAIFQRKPGDKKVLFHTILFPLYAISASFLQEFSGY